MTGVTLHAVVSPDESDRNRGQKRSFAGSDQSLKDMRISKTTLAVRREPEVFHLFKRSFTAVRKKAEFSCEIFSGPYNRERCLLMLGEMKT